MWTYNREASGQLPRAANSHTSHVREVPTASKSGKSLARVRKVLTRFHKWEVVGQLPRAREVVFFHLCFVDVHVALRGSRQLLLAVGVDPLVEDVNFPQAEAVHFVIPVNLGPIPDYCHLWALVKGTMNP